MAWGWDQNQEAYDTAYTNGRPNEAKLSHELLAGGAAFAGFKMFEDHQRAQGKPVSHQFAKELLVGFAAAEVDKLAETKGEDWFDKERAKHDAKKNAEHMYEEHYERRHGADEYDPERYGPHEHYERRREENRW
ncbi:hypothetical protein BP5796_12134 [Coleophoma crateriformis]|uniref:CipC-like antibiotic response protein n=1 Tax=Coleophoma crateriformis TaxID=565419 RepID=A0A3D8QC39_9HELO|nr:hypothetical protein BP5796_12134 [Coleophoma crateriformis]